MTISVGHEGQYKEAEAMWASKDGVWVPLIEPPPPLAVTLTFSGDVGPNGTFTMTINTPEPVTLIQVRLYITSRPTGGGTASVWDMTNVVVDQDTWSTTIPVTATTAEGALGGWNAGIYYAYISTADVPARVAESERIVVEGEILMEATKLQIPAKYWNDYPRDGTISSVYTNSVGEPRMYSADWLGWMVDPTVTVYSARYDLAASPSLENGWRFGTFDSVLLERSSNSNLGDQVATIATEPVVGQAYPAYTTQHTVPRETSKAVVPFVQSVWGIAAPGAVVTMGVSDVPGEYPYYPEVGGHSGFRSIQFISTSSTYDPMAGSIEQIDANTLKVTGDPGASISVYWEPAYQWSSDGVNAEGPLGRTLNGIILDANGEALLTAESFENVYWIAPVDYIYPGLQAGKYYNTSVDGAPFVAVNGKCPAYFWTATPYWKMVDLSSVADLYGFGDVYCMPMFAGTSDMSGYAYCYPGFGIHPPASEGWALTPVESLVMAESEGAKIFALQSPPPDNATAAPWPQETLLLDMSGMPLMVWHQSPIFFDTYTQLNGISAGARAGTPPIPYAADSFGLYCYVAIAIVFDAVYGA